MNVIIGHEVSSAQLYAPKGATGKTIHHFFQKLNCYPQGLFIQRKVGCMRMADNKFDRGYYRLEVKIKNREKHSAVACASYRSDESLYSERDGLVKTFRKHKVKPETFILKPSHAPDWALNRERLWNEVEKVEKHYKAQLAREVLLSIPNELNEEEQSKLIRRFVQNEFVNEGMVADVSIHRDDKNNPHAHVLLTMRSFKENGQWDNKSKRVQKVDSKGNPVFNSKGQRVTVSVKTNDWDKPETLLKWRENWAKELNKTMEENGIELRFSEKSFEEQGLTKLPLFRLSRQAYYLEKRAKEEAVKFGEEYEPVTYFGKQNKLIQEYNALLLEEQSTLEEIQKAQNNIDIKNPEQIKVINFIANYNTEFPLSNREKEAYSSVRKRAKMDVDFAVARKVFIEVSEGNIKKRLDNLKEKLNAKKHYINDVLKTEYAHDKGRNFSISVGFEPEYFNDYVSNRIQEYNKIQEDINKLESVRNSLLADAKIVLIRETNKVNAVFDYIYHDNIVHDKFTSPTLRYSASQSFVKDGIKAKVNENYKGQKNVEKYYNNLKRTMSLRDKFIEVNNKLVKNLYAYRINDRNVNKWIKYELGQMNENNKIPVNIGTHSTSLEKRELARKMVLNYRDQLDDLFKDVKIKYKLNENISLKDTVEILTGEDVTLNHLYGDKEHIFTKEYDSQSSRYKLLENHKYNQFNDMDNPHENHKNVGIEGVATSIFDIIGKADNDNNYYRTKKKKRKIKGKYRTVEDNEIDR